MLQRTPTAGGPAPSRYQRERLRIARAQSWSLLSAASQTRRNWQDGWDKATPARKAYFWRAHAEFMESASAWRRLAKVVLP